MAAKKQPSQKTSTDFVANATRSRHEQWTAEDFTPGDTVGVNVRVKEGEKERLQLFKGVVIKVQGKGMGRSFTVRKISSGIGVERTFPLASPAVESVKIYSQGKVRRSKLYYLRELKGRAARLTSTMSSVAAATEEAPAAAAE